MPTSTMSVMGSIGGISISGTVSRSGEAGIPVEASLPAASSGTLTTRTSDTAGEITVGAGHGFVQSDVIDIFWIDASGNLKCARKATVGVVAGNVIPFSGATGDILPAQDYAITADERVNILGAVSFDGDEATMLIVISTRNGHFCFEDAGGAILKAEKLLANEPWWWYSGAAANPLTGNPVTKLWMTNGDSTNAATVRFGAQLDTVP